MRWLTGERDYTPGGRGFMAQAWDRFVPPPALWDEALRVLKPGGFLVSFAGARTVDLMGLSIRLAGFEVRDILAWIRADAFAKAPGILKSGHEPIVMARKPLRGTLAANEARWGTGSLNIEGSRTPYRSAADEDETKTKNAHGQFGTRHGGNAVFGDFGDGLREDYNPPGRWPTNVLLDEAAAIMLDDASPVTRSRKSSPRRASAPGAGGFRTTHTGAEHDDVGGPSRFYPVVEPAGLSPQDLLLAGQAGFHYAGRATAKERPVAPDGTKHSTVKPLTVMHWLVNLVSMPGQVILDPFGGSGTTAEAAIDLGREVTIIEAESEFIPLIEQRVERALSRRSDTPRA
ncbi:MAG: hypothetical protein B7X32_20645 [Microbacterium sp. 13-71-7]|nr:MAG: hypothetical protein B7X32_20645 [Microbacterium sp. 13-71-7]